jgi:enoyl-CoA hydratase/carnithine racemase
MVTVDGIAYSTADGVATITFSRPERRNAMTAEMRQAYVESLIQADSDPQVRVILITGAGDAFCAGADFSRIDTLISDAQARTALTSETPPRYLPLTLSRPIVAAVNGPAVGLGFVYAVFSDVRFAATSATFSLPFARIGLVAEYGLSWLLPRLIGVGHASDLLLSSRTVDASEAAAMGLVQRVVDDDELLEVATHYARGMARHCSPRSLAVIKRQIFRDFDGGFRPAFERSLSHMAQSLEAPDVIEGVRALRERRSPVFPPYVEHPS